MKHTTFDIFIFTTWIFLTVKEEFVELSRQSEEESNKWVFGISCEFLSVELLLLFSMIPCKSKEMHLIWPRSSPTRKLVFSIIIFLKLIYHLILDLN